MGPDDGSHRARTGNPIPFRQSPAGLRRNDGPSPWIPIPVFWKFSFLRGYKLCEMYLTVTEVRHYPSAPLHLGDFYFFSNKILQG